MSPILLLIIGLLVVLGGILVLKLHPILALLLGALLVGMFTSSDLLASYAVSKGFSESQTTSFLNQSLGERILIAFGSSCEKIGLLIVLASIIGKCLLESGAAERIVRSVIGVFGEKNAPGAYMASSFVLAIPIFFDTVFYLMIPLARAMGIRKPKAYALCVMAIVAGGTMAHSLVPPTPGPLFAAGAFNVSIGLMIIVGTIVGLFCATGGLIYAFWLNKRQNIPVRTTSETSIEELKLWQEKDLSQLPSVFMANLPIALPVFLIAGKTILGSIDSGIPNGIRLFFNSTGEPIIALCIATAFALFLFAKQYQYKLKALKKPIEDAVYSAGAIILITATGGSFGAMLQQTSIGTWLAEVMPDYKLAVLPVAFLIAAVIRTAQGSATVAMITAVGMLTALNSPGALSFNPVYIAIVIGCGSKLFPWMNDSGFWIACKMSGFTEGETIRNFSVLLSVMGITGLFVTMILAKLFPLI
jgi:gluconate:H+ symporter, GntP family